MQWFTEAGLVIETTTGSRLAIAAALVAFAATAEWRLRRAGLARHRARLSLAATLAGAWVGGAWLGPALFGPVGYSSLTGGLLAMVTGLTSAAGLGLSPRRLADAFAPPALLALAIARLGCFFQGCDFGGPAEVPWAVRHRIGTRAFAWQRDHGLVGEFARLTEPVHPFALYEALPLLAAGALLWGWRSPGDGRVALAAVAAWTAVRAIAESQRAEPIVIAGLHLWVVLVPCALVAAAATAWRVRTPQPGHARDY